MLSHASVLALAGDAPPKVKAEERDVPEPPFAYLAVFNSETSAQFVPSYVSAFDTELL